MTAEEAKSTQWCFENEEWVQSGDSFKLEKLNGVELPKHLTDSDYLANARQNPDGRGYLPRHFKFSPVTGKALRERALSAWLPGNGNGNADRCTSPSLAPMATNLIATLQQHWRSGNTSMQQSAQKIQPPINSDLLFFSSDAGGYQPALFALGRSGALWLWQRGSQQWLPLHARNLPLARHPFEHWAAAVVTLPGAAGCDLILASDEGADFVHIDPTNLAYEVERAMGRALGAPGRVGDLAMVPLVDGGAVEVAIRIPGKSWYLIPVDGDMPTSVGEFSAPVTSISGQGLTWISELGALSVSKVGSAVAANWQPWPTDLVARPMLGPPYRNGEGDWQLLQNLTSKKWSSRLLNSPMVNERQARRASTGTALNTFQLDVKVKQPWDDYDPDDHPEANKHVIHPFLDGEHLASLLYLRAPNLRQTLISFYENLEPQPVQYCVGWPMTPSNVYQLETSKPWNAQWFIHDGALWLWVDGHGSLLRWNAP